jgi:hypothetical protein
VIRTDCQRGNTSSDQPPSARRICKTDLSHRHQHRATSPVLGDRTLAPPRVGLVIVPVDCSSTGRLLVLGVAAADR